MYRDYAAGMKPATARSLPIKNLRLEPLIPLMGRANRAISGYNAMIHRLPAESLLLAPLSTQEAVLSSRIEGTFATVTEVLQFEAGETPEKENTRHDIEEIINYREALDIAERELARRPFSLNLILKLHKALLTSVRGHNKLPGRFRRMQNHIGSRAGGVETIRFTPPAWETLEGSLRNWESYYHMEEPDPLVQLAVVHAQFEFLHPFLDGNGRLGRILIPIFLYEKELLSRPTFYLSAYLEEHRDEYIDRLHGLDSRDGWTRWCAFFLEGVSVQAERNARRADAVLALYEQQKGRFLARTRSQFAVPLLDAIFRQPIFRATQLKLGGDQPSRPTLTNLLNEMVAEGALRVSRPARGRIGQIYAMEDLLEIVERID